MSITSLAASPLRHAVALKEQVEKLPKELASLLGAPETPAPTAAPKKRKGKMRAAGRANICAAQQAR